MHSNDSKTSIFKNEPTKKLIKKATMEEKYKSRLMQLGMKILDNNHAKILLTNFANIQSISNETLALAKEMKFNDDFLITYKECAGYIIEWEEENSTEGDIMGAVNLRILSRVLQNTEGLVYFENDVEPDDPIKDFHIVDEFTNEVQVGIYAGENATSSLYLMVIGEDDPTLLELDIKGYLEMVLACNGFLYWQEAIINYSLGKECRMATKMKTHMPRLFPGWTWEEFISKYEEVKLKY